MEGKVRTVTHRVPVTRYEDVTEELITLELTKNQAEAIQFFLTSKYGGGSTFKSYEKSYLLHQLPAGCLAEGLIEVVNGIGPLIAEANRLSRERGQEC